MNENKFYKFIQEYAIPHNFEVVRNRLSGFYFIAREAQEEKIDEELQELFEASSHFTSALATWIIYQMGDELFLAFYEEYIKNTYESEMTDVLLAKCTLLSINRELMAEKHLPPWYTKAHLCNLLQYVAECKSDIYLHIKAKIRYNSLRNDWK